MPFVSPPVSTVVTSPEKPLHASAKTSRVARNVLFNWGAYFMAMGINFFVSPYVVRHLGNVGYGVWTLILSLTGYLGLLDFGIRGAVTRYVAKFHSQADDKKASEIASSAMVIFGSTGVIAILVSFVLALFVIGHMNVPSAYLTAARIILLLTGLSVAISLVNGVFGGILVGLQRFDVTNTIEICLSVLRAVAIVIALHVGYGIIMLGCVQLAFSLARLVINAAMARDLYPGLRIRLSMADRNVLKLVFSFSAFSFLWHMSASLIYASDNIVIGAYLPVTAVTFYVIAGNLVEYARALVSGISQPMTPLASSIEGNRDPRQLQNLVLLSSRWASMVILPVTCTFILRGSSFIGLWMGYQYADLSGQVLSVLSVTIVFWAANCATAGILLGISKHKPIVPALLAEGLCNLALSVFLVKRIGIVGVAWGTLVPNLIDNLIFWPWYIRRALGVGPYRYVISAWVRPVVSLFPFVLGTYAIERYWPASGLLLFFCQVALVLPLALPGYWFISLDRDQRAEYSSRFFQSLERIFARG